MKKFFSILFVFFIGTGPTLAWGWSGNGDCPFSKDKGNQETKEQVEESNQ